MAGVIRRYVFKTSALALLAPVGAYTSDGNRDPDLGECQVLRADEGSKVAFRAYAEGYQVYRWTGTGWAFVGPEAILFDNDGEVVGIHYAGPTWESLSGSKVRAVVSERCTPDPDAIPWLLLDSVGSEGPGIFHRVTQIQRLYT